MKSFHERLIKIANEEHEFFGSQLIDTLGRVRKRGKTETDVGYWNRVGMYWSEIGGWTKDKTGKDTDWPWSAVFISYCIKLAGMEEREFKFAISHSQYILASMRNEIPWQYLDVNYNSPKVGDLLCYHREQKGTIIFEDLFNSKTDFFRSHADIVVKINEKSVSVIGGNVSNGVTKRNIPLINGIVNSNLKEWFCILRYENMFS